MCTYIQDIHIYIYTHIIFASLAFPTAATAHPTAATAIAPTVVAAPRPLRPTTRAAPASNWCAAPRPPPRQQQQKFKFELVNSIGHFNFELVNSILNWSVQV